MEVDYRKPAIIGPWYYQCDLPGVAGTTPVYVKETPSRIDGYSTKYEARVGVAIFGAVGDTECYNKSPFDDDWYDNYIGAKAYTQDMLYKILQRNMKDLQDSLWAGD